MSSIKKILSREIIDSRGIPTIETEVHLKTGFIGRASCPSGSSTGSKEAVELRDNDKNRFFGKGVKKAINFVNNEIANILINTDSSKQKDIDEIMIELDGTKNKSKLGANSILSVSLAVAKATAKENRIPFYKYISELYGIKKKFVLPLPMINIINGGVHAQNNIDIQEFMIQPVSAKNITEAIRMGSEIFHMLGTILKKKGLSTCVGDEGGYSPNLNSNEEALSLMSLAVEKSKYILGKDITFAIDCAASEFYNKKTQLYFLKNEKKKLNSKELTLFLENLTLKYPISSIEDGQDEQDWNGFIYQTKRLGNKIQLVGDDLFVTNEKIFKEGIKKGIVNSILIKLNQIGTLTETLKTIKLAQKNNYNTIISHRSGETEDTSISDLAVGTSSGQIKTGSMSRSERTSKYNRLIRIEENLNTNNSNFFDISKLQFFKKK